MKIKYIIVLFLMFAINSLIAQSIDLKIKVFLEGPFIDGKMIDNLRKQELIPQAQPFNVSPWNYDGSESWVNLPSTNVVDWLLIDLVAPGSVSDNPTYDIMDRQAALVRHDGQVISTEGNEILNFQADYGENIHIQVHHRNHLSVTSHDPIIEIGPGVYEYDFSLAPNESVDGMNAQKQVEYGVWGAMAGDGDASNQINNRDKNDVWFSEHDQTGYLMADYNLDGTVNQTDLIDKWSENAGYGFHRRLGLLEVCAENPRYFCSGGKPVFLTGSHCWDNLQDVGDVAFNYDDYLNWMDDLGHNFIRIWAWETPHGTDWAKDPDMSISPVPYVMVGNQFDVSQLNPEYFERLRQRLQAADEKGIYVSVMFFQGFSAEHTPVAWQFHPFKAGNNINGIAAGQFEVHTNIYPEVVEAQRLYVRAIIDMVNYYEFTNVIYEIGNEIPHSPDSDIWHYDIIDYIHEYETEKYGVSRPVGMVFQYSNGDNETLFNSPADWISPGPEDGFDCQESGDAPISTGDKVIISDTDHFYYLKYHNNGNPHDMVWKSFTGGIQVIHMDNWGGGSNQAGRLHGGTGTTTYNVIRNNMGYARELAEEIDLINTLPQPQLSSTGYCLASENNIVVYLPEGVSNASVNLADHSGQFAVRWLNTDNGLWQTANFVSGGSTVNFNSPFSEYSVLVLSK